MNVMNDLVIKSSGLWECSVEAMKVFDTCMNDLYQYFLPNSIQISYSDSRDLQA